MGFTLLRRKYSALVDIPISYNKFPVSYFRFYRYVLEPNLQFNEDGHLATGPHAVFRDIPETPLLTMNLDIPQAWMVEAVKSPYDLDNIYLKEVRVLKLL